MNNFSMFSLEMKTEKSLAAPGENAPSILKDPRCQTLQCVAVL